MTAPTSLIVVLAFNLNDEGELVPAFEPQERQSEEKAARDAKIMAGSGQYAGVIAWSRSARPDIGEFGEPKVLFQWGKIPEME